MFVLQNVKSNVDEDFNKSNLKKCNRGSNEQCDLDFWHQVVSH